MSECMTRLSNKVKEFLQGVIRISHKEPTFNTHNHTRQREYYQDAKQNTPADRFNLIAISDLFAEFDVDIKRGAALRLLLDTISANTYFNLVSDFYYNSIDVSSILHKWDKISCRQYAIHPATSDIGSIYVLMEEVDLYLHNCNIYIDSNTSPAQKVQLLINHSFKEGYDKFVKRYESRINILKSDSSSLEVFDNIKSEMKSYLNF